MHVSYAWIQLIRPLANEIHIEWIKNNNNNNNKKTAKKRDWSNMGIFDFIPHLSRRGGRVLPTKSGWMSQSWVESNESELRYSPKHPHRRISIKTSVRIAPILPFRVYVYCHSIHIIRPAAWLSCSHRLSTCILYNKSSHETFQSSVLDRRCYC